jgi:murein tripeptide amidase MpaA
MVNPDGVVLGNTRCAVSGKDLNRRWTTPDKVTSAEVLLVKEDMKRSAAKREIHIFADLHGHS